MQKYMAMRKVIVWMIFGCCFSGEVLAQKGNLQLGFHTGSAIVSMRGNDGFKQDHESDLRLAVGLDVKYKLRKGFYVASQLNYETKGSGIKTRTFYDALGNEIARWRGVNKLNFITLPFMLGKDLGKKKIFNIQLGLFAGFMTSANNTNHFENGDVVKSDNEEFYKKTDFGVSGGAGVSLPLIKKMVLSLQVQDNLGLMNLAISPYTDEVAIRIHSLNITAGILFTL